MSIEPGVALPTVVAGALEAEEAGLSSVLHATAPAVRKMTGNTQVRLRVIRVGDIARTFAHGSTRVESAPPAINGMRLRTGRLRRTQDDSGGRTPSPDHADPETAVGPITSGDRSGQSATSLGTFGRRGILCYGALLTVKWVL